MIIDMFPHLPLTPAFEVSSISFLLLAHLRSVVFSFEQCVIQGNDFF